MKLLEKARSESPYDEIDKDTLIREIKKKGGSDDRSIKRYIDELKDMGAIESYTRDTLKVYKPEDYAIEPSGERRRMRVSVSEKVLDLCEKDGISPGVLLEVAAARYMDDITEYISIACGNEVSEDEAEYIALLVAHDLHKKGNTPAKERKNEQNRERWYKAVFNTYNLDADDFERIDDLREKAFEAAVEMGVQETVEF